MHLAINNSTYLWQVRDSTFNKLFVLKSRWVIRETNTQGVCTNGIISLLDIVFNKNCAPNWLPKFNMQLKAPFNYKGCWTLLDLMWRFIYEYSIRFTCTLRKTHNHCYRVAANLWPDTVRKSWICPSWRSWTAVVSTGQVWALCGTGPVAKLPTTEAFVGGELAIGAKISSEEMTIVLCRIQVAALVLRFVLSKSSSCCRFRFAFKLHFGHRPSLAVTEFFLFLVVGQLTGHMFVNRRPPCLTLVGKYSNYYVQY